jgi:type II secretory ATPase GspE/PulE/Tfp pilus assembly ATPase PilB-like protein
MNKEIDYTSKELIDRIIQKAIQTQASDIHFDPTQNTLVVRFRIDGTLYAIETLSKEFQSELISRIKVLSEIDIAQYRIPQCGNFEFTSEEKKYNFRTSTFPTPYGEAIVLRILNRESILLPLEKLGLDNNQLENVKTLIHNPYGIILITGPSGAGKTTFLYSALNILNNLENNIVTAEDPIEFRMKDIRQMQINENIGLTFAEAMKTILRQDPDIIMIGEIRDSNTIHMATQASLSGRLVLSTFHTFDMPALVIRLVEMGISTSVIAHTLLGVISIRLIRKICPSCKTIYKLNKLEQRIMGSQNISQNFQKGKGCFKCHNSGYLGRTGIFEIISLDEEIQSYILEKKSAYALSELIREKKIKSLRESAIEKVLQGITTAEEVIRVTGIHN